MSEDHVVTCSFHWSHVVTRLVADAPKSREHRERHPFGKAPVLECDGSRILETSAILRYANNAFEGPSFIPDNPVDRARMDIWDPA
jgi:glutathione S-transferase